MIVEHQGIRIVVTGALDGEARSPLIYWLILFVSLLIGGFAVYEGLRILATIQ